VRDASESGVSVRTPRGSAVAHSLRSSLNDISSPPPLFNGKRPGVKQYWRAGLGFVGFVLSLGLCGDATAEVGGHVEGLAADLEGHAPALRVLVGNLVQLGIVGAVALPFQVLAPAVRRRPKALSYEFWLDVLYWCQGAWLIPLSFFAAIGWTIHTVYGGSGPWLPALARLPYWAQVALAVWVFDFVVYWRHRLEHRLPVLWSFHAVHHTAEKVDVLTTTRLHPIEIALGAVCNAAIVRLGLDPAASALGFGIYIHYNYFIHTNVRIRFGRLAKYVLVSPFMHQWHHAKESDAMGKNVGVVFAWNDWLFGTAYHPDRWPAEFGLAAPAPERVGQSYLRHLLYPLQYGLARTRARRGATAV
jgi:sterol desaturase/sphingolipid hydroxylase (fatty acid hydroxylase superfamily)